MSEYQHKKLTTYYVRPRYTAGSPDAVDKALALRISREENDAYRVCLSGRRGADAQGKAIREGVSGIVEAQQEHRGHVNVIDMITGETSVRKITR